MTVSADAKSTDEVINHDGNGHRTVRSGFQDKLGPFEESESKKSSVSSYIYLGEKKWYCTSRRVTSG